MGVTINSVSGGHAFNVTEIPPEITAGRVIVLNPLLTIVTVSSKFRLKKEEIMETFSYEPRVYESVDIESLCISKFNEGKGFVSYLQPPMNNILTSDFTSIVSLN